jgi:hypothetical protein
MRGEKGKSFCYIRVSLMGRRIKEGKRIWGKGKEKEEGYNQFIEPMGSSSLGSTN